MLIIYEDILNNLINIKQWTKYKIQQDNQWSNANHVTKNNS